ncbi:hypothetical protein [Streptomyces sp. NPDC002564]|uniref:hypothetical protein n=1 Tax=Streptomyces sp. NPDC002564 TaxID=3364649 RepID=UPI0036A0722B
MSTEAPRSPIPPRPGTPPRPTTPPSAVDRTADAAASAPGGQPAPADPASPADHADEAAEPPPVPSARFPDARPPVGQDWVLGTPRPASDAVAADPGKDWVLGAPRPASDAVAADPGQDWVLGTPRPASDAVAADPGKDWALGTPRPAPDADAADPGQDWVLGTPRPASDADAADPGQAARIQDLLAPFEQARAEREASGATAPPPPPPASARLPDAPPTGAARPRTPPGTTSPDTVLPTTQDTPEPLPPHPTTSGTTAPGSPVADAPNASVRTPRHPDAPGTTAPGPPVADAPTASGSAPRHPFTSGPASPGSPVADAPTASGRTPRHQAAPDSTAPGSPSLDASGPLDVAPPRPLAPPRPTGPPTGAPVADGDRSPSGRSGSASVADAATAPRTTAARRQVGAVDLTPGPGAGRPFVSFARPAMYDDTTTRLRPVGGWARPRAVAAAACAVIGLGLIGGAVTGSWLTDESAAGGARPGAYTVTGGLWHSVPVDRLFPPVLKGEGAGPGGADRSWTRIAVAPDSGCRSAFDPLLRKALAPAGCLRLLRATYADATRSHVTTVGLLFTKADADGMQALRNRFTEEGLDRRTDLMPRPYARKGTAAAGFGDAQRASWTVSVLPDAPVVAYAVSGFADGRTVTEPEPATEAMGSDTASPAAQSGLGHEAKGIADRIERGLRKIIAAAGKSS